MASKSNETINGRYFFRWNTPEGQAAIKAANIALASSGLQIYYDNGMAPGLIGAQAEEVQQLHQQHAQTVAEAQRVEAEEQARQQAARDMVAAAEKRAAENGN